MNTDPKSAVMQALFEHSEDAARILRRATLKTCDRETFTMVRSLPKGSRWERRLGDPRQPAEVDGAPGYLVTFKLERVSGEGETYAKAAADVARKLARYVAAAARHGLPPAQRSEPKGAIDSKGGIDSDVYMSMWEGAVDRRVVLVVQESIRVTASPGCYAIEVYAAHQFVEDGDAPDERWGSGQTSSL